MSMGNFNTYNKQDDKKKYSPTVYSSYRCNNAESEIDQTAVTFTYWNNLLKIGIFPKKQTNNDEVSFDMENGLQIYINHTKARIFAEEIKQFLMDPIGHNSCGIASNNGALLTISNGSEFGKKAACLVLRKVDETGAIVSSFVYEFKRDTHFAIRNYEENSTGGKFDRITEEYNSIEILQLITLLEEYYKAMTCAIAYTVVEQAKYDNTRITNKIEAIGEKLGVDFGSKRSEYKSNSYFNNTPSSKSGSQTFTSASLEDLESNGD